MTNKFRLRRILILSFLTISFLLVSCSNTQGNWQVYSFPEGEFSIVFPVTPNINKDFLKTSDGQKIPMNMIQSRYKNSIYSVTFIEYTEDTIEQGSSEKLLSKAIDAAIKNSMNNGKLNKQEQKKIGNVPCEKFEAEGKIQQSEVTFKGLFCLDKLVFYQISVLGISNDIFEYNANKFIASFDLLKEVKK